LAEAKEALDPVAAEDPGVAVLLESLNAASRGIIR
jgi:UDP-N-acetylglucosamine acyltransferase